MKKLIFKKLGWFAEELSARYEATFSENAKVQIFKSIDTKSWVAYFVTSADDLMESFTGDYLSCLPTLNKRELIEYLEEYLNSDEAGEVETAAINKINSLKWGK